MKICIKCGSHAFNLYAEEIDQGGLCDVHYWQGRAHRAEALAQPDYRAVKTYHEGNPVYVSQPEQEPVAWLYWLHGPVHVFLNKDEAMMELDRLNRDYPVDKNARQMKSLYTTPPKRPWGKPWVSLTDDEFLSIVTWRGPVNNPHFDRLEYAKAIEAKLKEKNT